jgi:RNA polymerase sigma factor (sigma-70 family)
MAARAKTLLRYIRGIAAPPANIETSDSTLVDRFLANGDDRAFSDLVERHGALVLNVCRRTLGNGDDAEDAFQATFLVLARKARSVRSYTSLASWLYGVARRVSLKARSLRAQRYRLEMAARHEPIPRPDPVNELSSRELLAILDGEVERLPERQRLPVLLCCLEGLSLEEAAARLGWKRGAVKGHLQRGRHRLHHRLARRGLTLTAALTAVEAARGPALAAVVVRLAGALARGAREPAGGRTAPAAGISPGATVLARAVLRTIALNRLAIAAGLLLPVLVVAVGFAVRDLAQPPSAERAQSEAAPLPAVVALVADQPAEAADEDDVPIQVAGRVLDPAGKPFAGANLYVGYTVLLYVVPWPDSPKFVLPSRAKSDADGRFQFTFSRSELDARMLDDCKPAVIAVADGYGPEWSAVVDPRQAEALTLRLVEDFPINGRLRDSKGKPVEGARFRVLNVETREEPNGAYRRRWRGAFPERPSEVTTDADGRFRLTGLGRGREVILVQDEPASPAGLFYAVAAPSASYPNSPLYGGTFDRVASDTRLVRGVCRDRATGRPLAGVRMSLWHSTTPPRFTDAKGRFELPMASDLSDLRQGDICVVAEPENNEPYFTASTIILPNADSEPITVNFDLIRGIAVQGVVRTTPGTKPPRTGRVEYYPLHSNTHAAKLQTAVYQPASSGVIQPDGSYRLAVFPGPGAVAVGVSPKKAFATAMVDDQELDRLFHDGKKHQNERGPFISVGQSVHSLSSKVYNAVSLIDPGEGTESLALDIELQTGVRLHGLLSDPDGRPLTGVVAAGLTYQNTREIVEGPAFEIVGMNPKETREVMFLHRATKLGRRLTVRGDETGPLEVRLEPCGTITGRIVGQDGLPIPDGWVWPFSIMEDLVEDYLVRADNSGRFEKVLMPRKKYLIRAGLLRSGMANSPREIALEPGQTLDLGDVLGNSKRGSPPK